MLFKKGVILLPKIKTVSCLQFTVYGLRFTVYGLWFIVFNNLKESIMKKVLFAVMAMIAIGFASCTNKAQAPAEAEGVNIEEVIGDATSQLQSAIDAADAGKLQEVLDYIKAKAAELDPAVAKEYVQKVQEFLKENADKIKAFVGENETINSAITALTAAPADAIVSGLKSAVGAAGDAIEDAKDAATDAVEGAVDDAKDAAGDAIDAAAEKAKEALGN